METFKQFMAFPLYATVIWLAWVLGSQRDNDAVLRLLAVLLCLGFALWAWRKLAEAEIRRLLPILKQGGGYIVAPCHSFGMPKTVSAGMLAAISSA